jgi:hypothetical protein
MTYLECQNFLNLLHISFFIFCKEAQTGMTKSNTSLKWKKNDNVI